MIMGVLGFLVSVFVLATLIIAWFFVLNAGTFPANLTDPDLTSMSEVSNVFWVIDKNIDIAGKWLNGIKIWMREN